MTGVVEGKLYGSRAPVRAGLRVWGNSWKPGADSESAFLFFAVDVSAFFFFIVV